MDDEVLISELEDENPVINLLLEFDGDVPSAVIVAAAALRRNIRTEREEMIRIKWLLHVLPLPIVNYPLLWRRFRRYDWRGAMARAVTSIVSSCVRMLHWLLYFIVLGHYARNAIHVLLIFASLATFSENVFVDIYSYVMRDCQLLLDIRADLFTRNDQTDPESIIQAIYQKLALNLTSTCDLNVVFGPLNEGEKRAQCTIYKKALIFSFSKVFEDNFPLLNKLPAFFLTGFTIFVYVIYVLLAQVVGFNVLFFFMLLMSYRTSRFLPLYTRFSKSVWKGLKDLIL